MPVWSAGLRVREQAASRSHQLQCSSGQSGHSSCVVYGQPSVWPQSGRFGEAHGCLGLQLKLCSIEFGLDNNKDRQKKTYLFIELCRYIFIYISKYTLKHYKRLCTGFLTFSLCPKKSFSWFHTILKFKMLEAHPQLVVQTTRRSAVQSFPWTKYITILYSSFYVHLWSTDL